MKTVCLYFQVHQPWRLKKYRFFNMGKDHNYLDDLLNRSIMQKVARQCYLPMNALLLKLIKENKGKFRCSFSITGIAVEQFRAYAPEVLDSFKELAATGCVEFLAETYSHSLASLASKEDFVEQVKLHTAMHQEGVRRETHGLPQYGADLLGRHRRHGRRNGLPHDACRGSQARARLEVAQLRLRQRRGPETPSAAAQLQTLGRHRLPLLEPELGPVAADGRQVREVALVGGDPGRSDQPLHGLRDLRRAPDRRHGHLRVHARPAEGHPRARRASWSSPR